MQHASPSPSPWICSNSSPLRQWCHPTILSSVIPFSSCPQSFPVSGSFPMSQLFAWSSQSIGTSASAPVLPLNIQLISFRIGWFDLPAVQGTLKSFLQHHCLKASILWCSVFFLTQLSHPYMTTGKIIALTTQIFVSKVMSLLFNSFSSKEQASFNFVAAVTVPSDFGAQENKICHCFHFCPFYLPRSDGTRFQLLLHPARHLTWCTL